MVELGEEDEETNVTERDDAGVDAVDGDVGEVSVGDKTCLVTTVMLDVVDEVESDLLMSLRRGNVGTMINEGFVLKDLVEFHSHGVLPAGVLVLLIHPFGVGEVLGDLKTVLVTRCGMEGTKLGLICEAEEFLLSLDDVLEPFSPWSVKEVVLLDVDGAGDGIIRCNDGEGLGGGLPSLPFDHDVVGAPFPVGM